MEIMHDLVELMVRTGFADRDRIQGCAPEDVAEIEAHYGVRLPAMYRAFLFTMGRRAGWLFVTHVWFYPWPLQLRRRAEATLKESGHSFTLADDAFVFLMRLKRERHTFHYFHINSGDDDPLVFRYVQPDPAPQLLDRFSAFVRHEVTDQIAWFNKRGLLHVPRETRPSPDGVMRDLTERMVSTGFAQRDQIRGCTAEEVVAIEEHYQLRLPSMYRAFLLTMGWGAGSLFGGTDLFFSQPLELRRAALELLAENDNPFTLPDDAFVFAMHHGYTFAYFHTADGDDDPVVYSYLEPDPAPKQLGGRFSDFLTKEVVSQIAWLIKWGHVPDPIPQ